MRETKIEFGFWGSKFWFEALAKVGFTGNTNKSHSLTRCLNGRIQV